MTHLSKLSPELVPALLAPLGINDSPVQTVEGLAYGAVLSYSIFPSTPYYILNTLLLLYSG